MTMCISYGLNCSSFSRYWQFWIHFHWSNVMIHEGGQDYSRYAGARPTNTVLRSNSKFYQHLEGVLWIKIRSTDHNAILHTSSQLRCSDMCKISLWSAENAINRSIAKFHWISSSIEISLMVRAPGVISTVDTSAIVGDDCQKYFLSY